MVRAATSVFVDRTWALTAAERLDHLVRGAGGFVAEDVETSAHPFGVVRPEAVSAMMTEPWPNM
jgi:hypothetical protein